MATAPAPVKNSELKEDGTSAVDKTGTHAYGGAANAKVIIQTAEPTSPEEVARAVLDLIRADRQEDIDALIEGVVCIKVRSIQERESFQQREAKVTQDLRTATAELDNLKRRNDELEERVKIVDDLHQQIEKLDQSRQDGNKEDDDLEEKHHQLRKSLTVKWKRKLQVADDMGDIHKTRANNFEMQVEEFKRERDKDKDAIASLSSQISELLARKGEGGDYMYADESSEVAPAEQQQHFLSKTEGQKISKLEGDKRSCLETLQEECEKLKQECSDSEDEIEILSNKLELKNSIAKLREEGHPKYQGVKYQDAKEKAEKAQRAVAAAEAKASLKEEIRGYQGQIDDIKKQAMERPRINLQPPTNDKNAVKRGNYYLDSAISGLGSLASRSRGASVTGAGGDARVCPECGQRRWSVG